MKKLEQVEGTAKQFKNPVVYLLIHEINIKRPHHGSGQEKKYRKKEKKRKERSLHFIQTKSCLQFPHQHPGQMVSEIFTSKVYAHPIHLPSGSGFSKNVFFNQSNGCQSSKK